MFAFDNQFDKKKNSATIIRGCLNDGSALYTVSDLQLKWWHRLEMNSLHNVTELTIIYYHLVSVDTSHKHKMT